MTKDEREKDEERGTVEPADGDGLIRMAALMTVPMCGWNPHWGAANEALRPFNIPVRVAYGAYWHQSMSNLLEESVEDGLDWVLTMDYDSLFTAEQLDRLISRFGRHGELDALCALQAKRGTEEVALVTRKGQELLQVTGAPIEVDTAHFGLTLIRCEALKRLPMPWFVSVPDPRGSYRTLERCDADIYFWHKFREAGLRVAMDPLCAIGHLQPLVATYDHEYQVKHVHVTDWREDNRRLKL